MDDLNELNANSVDAGDLFDVDINADLDKERKDNVFAGIEDKLGLPFGSTKDGIKAAKDEVKSIKAEAATLKTESAIIAKKESLASLPVARFTIDDLAMDRAKLRDSYMRLLDRGMDMLNRIQEQLDALVNPEPDDYAAWQKQYLACLKTLDSIKGALVTLRQEEDLKNIKVTSTGAPENADATSDHPASERSDTAIEVTSRETNAWIKEWVAELDAQTKREIEADHSARLAEQAVAGIEKQRNGGN